MQSNLSGTSRAGGVGTTLSLMLLATLLIAAAALFSFKLLQPKIERDLTARVATALRGTDANNFSIDGQDVILAGVVATDADRKRAEESAQSVYGVSNVINKLTIEGEETSADASETDTKPEEEEVNEAPLVLDTADTGTTSPTLTIAANNGKVNTQGIVADSETIDRINNALAGKFGRGNVNDELSSFEGSISPEWLGGMLSMIDQLDGISDPVLKVTGNDLVLGGSVNAEEIRRVKLATAERLFGSELNVIDNLTVKEVKAKSDATDDSNAEVATAVQAEPEIPAKRAASLEILSSNNQISLTGFVGSAADADQIRDGMNNLFGANGFDDELTISNSVESADWISDALIVISRIQNISDFGVNIRAGQMRLSGSVEDRETGRDLAIAATEIAGGKLGVLNNFSVNNVTITDTNEDLLAQSLMQELDALPTRNIVFNKNSTTLTDSAKEVLQDVAAAILGYSDLVVEIAGHTDTSGDAVRNLRLSKQRATAVRDYLVERDVPASRLSPIGYGETAPIRDNETSAGRAANRRIEFNL